MTVMARQLLSFSLGFPPVGGTIMAKPLVSDALWQRIEPLLPPPKRRRFRFPGRRPLDYRKILTGIVFVLKTGLNWEDLPAELGWGCGKTCKQTLKAWQAAGIWEQLHRILLEDLQEADRIDWSRGAVDSTKARALGGGDDTGPNPTDRSKLGTKHHVITDAQGIPLATTVTGANEADVTQLLPLVDSIPDLSGPEGDKPTKPKALYADRGYDSEPHREELRDRGIEPKIAKRRTEHGSGLGIYRWVVERTEAWLHNFRKLRLRTDPDGAIHKALVALGSALICLRFL
jgi:transposase